jgi:hypothetical protein
LRLIGRGEGVDRPGVEGEGLSLADILKIPKEERDALLAQGIRQMQVGDVA